MGALRGRKQKVSSFLKRNSENVQRAGAFKQVSDDLCQAKKQRISSNPIDEMADVFFWRDNKLRNCFCSCPCACSNIIKRLPPLSQLVQNEEIFSPKGEPSILSGDDVQKATVYEPRPLNKMLRRFSNASTAVDDESFTAAGPQSRRRSYLKDLLDESVNGKDDTNSQTRRRSFLKDLLDDEQQFPARPGRKTIRKLISDSDLDSDSEHKRSSLNQKRDSFRDLGRQGSARSLLSSDSSASPRLQLLKNRDLLLNKQVSTRSLLTIDSNQFDHSKSRLEHSLHSLSSTSQLRKKNSMNDLRERGFLAMQNSLSNDSGLGNLRRQSINMRRGSATRPLTSKSSDVSSKRRSSRKFQRMDSAMSESSREAMPDQGRHSFRAKGVQLRSLESHNSLYGHTDSLASFGNFNKVSRNSTIDRRSVTKLSRRSMNQQRQNATWDNPKSSFQSRGIQMRTQDSKNSLIGHSDSALSLDPMNGFRPSERRSFNNVRLQSANQNATWDTQNTAAKKTINPFLRGTIKQSNISPEREREGEYPEERSQTSLDMDTSSRTKSSTSRSDSPLGDSCQSLDYWTRQISRSEAREDDGNASLASFSDFPGGFSTGNILKNLGDKKPSIQPSTISSGSKSVPLQLQEKDSSNATSSITNSNSPSSDGKKNITSSISNSNSSEGKEKGVSDADNIISESDDDGYVTSSSDSSSERREVGARGKSSCLPSAKPQNEVDVMCNISRMSLGDLYEVSSNDESSVAQETEFTEDKDNFDSVLPPRSGLRSRSWRSSKKPGSWRNSDKKNVPKKESSLRSSFGKEKKKKWSWRSRRNAAKSMKEGEDLNSESKPDDRDKGGERSPLMLFDPLVLTRDLLQEEFDMIDKSGDGKIRKEELWEYISSGKLGNACMNETSFDALWSCMDTDGTGEVDFINFCRFMEQPSIDDSSKGAGVCLEVAKSA